MSKPQKQGAETSLAGYLSSLKSNEHSQKLNIVGKGIVKIGNAIPSQYKDAKVLYLSRNHLKNLDNVQQFTNLRAFSAADNLLPSFSSVAALQSLTALEAVSLDGNPLTDLPNYRHRIICIFSKSPLHQLDGKAVSLEDKEMAASLCAVEDAILSLAVSTQCLINSFTRAHMLWNLHNEMYDEIFRHERKLIAGRKYRQNSISRLASYFEQQREISMDLNDDDFHTEKQQMEAKFVAEAIAWHEKLLKSSAATGLQGGKSSSMSWHAAFCRILANQAAQLENLVRLTTESNPTTEYIEKREDTTTVCDTAVNIATIFLALRETLKQLSTAVRPGIDKDAIKHAEELSNSLIEMQYNLVRELSTVGTLEESSCKDKAGDDFSNWLIPANSARGALRATPTSATKFSTSLELITPNNRLKDIPTLAAQHIVATEAVARLERSLDEAEKQAVELSETLATTTQKADSLAAENQLLRQEQVAAKEANAALQHWLENANKTTEAAKIQVEMLTANLSQAHEMHAVDVANLSSLQSENESLQSQIEEVKAKLQSDAGKHEHALLGLESEIAFLQHDKVQLVEQLEAALLAAQIASEQPQPIKLEVHVFLARELEVEKAKNAELEQEVAAVAAQFDEILELQKMQAAAAEEVLRAKIARKAELDSIKEYGIAVQARRISGVGLAAWRVAAQRSRKLTAFELHRRTRTCSMVFSNWKSHTKSALLFNLLNIAVVASAKLALKEKLFFAWRSTTAILQSQIIAELPETDPRVHRALQIAQNRYTTSPFQAWRNLTQAELTNNEALIVFSVAQREAEKLKEAFTLWRETTEIRREESYEMSCGHAARKVVFSSHVLRAWQRATRRATALAIAEAAATRASKRTLLTTTLAAWVECRNNSAEEALIVQEEEECQALEALQQEIAFKTAEKKAEVRAHSISRALQRRILSTWRTEVAYSKHIGALSTWCASSIRRQLLLKSLGCWRAVVYSDQVEDLAQQLGQTEASLRVASSEIAMKEQEIEDCTALRLHALSRVEELEEKIAVVEEQLAAAADEASLLQKRLHHVEADKRDAEEAEERAVLEAEAAVALEQEARRAAEDACYKAQKEREKAIANALSSTSQAEAALEACKIAEQRAQAAEESRVEAEIVAIDALESVEAASSACERLAEECAGLHLALHEANERHISLQERYNLATETIDTLTAAEERYTAEQTDLQRQLQAVQQRWREAEEAKEIAESDAHVAIRQSQRLAEMLEQHVQHQEHPLALIYK